MERNHIAVVTGGSRGIGAATAKLAAQAGYRVCIASRHREKDADEVVAAIQRDGGEAMAVSADVGREADVVRLFDAVDRRFGEVTALVNNAGILERQMRVEEMDAERLTRVFNANVVGSFLCAREAVRRMSTRHGGHGGAIVNVSSVAARLGSPNEYIDYAASKAAIDTLTVGLAKEVAGGRNRVNCGRPGSIYTEIHASGGEPGRVDRVKARIPMQRGGEAEEIARAIVWLLSDEASYMTGSLVDVAGGL